MTTLNDYLHQHAGRQPRKVAAVCGDQCLTYAELSERVRWQAAEYREGKIVPFVTTQSLDFLVTCFAIHEAGAVAAPLPSACPTLPPSEEVLPSGRVGGEASLPPLGEGRGRGLAGEALLLFTTGTTGTRKGVMISHRAIIADAENLIEGQHFTPDLTFIINGPLNHIGSLSKIWPVIMQGATLHILEGMKDLNAFFCALSAYPKTATFLVPASTRIILQFSADRLAACAGHIDFIESGAAPLPHADMLQLCQLLPNTRLYNTYASTETGIISTYNFNDGRCMPGCLGQPMSHSRIIITPEGHISCQGDTLMSGYIWEESCSPPKQGELEGVSGVRVFTTSDLGYLDAEGMLHLTGREGDVINVGGFKVAPTEVEDACMSAPGVRDCVCISVEHPITGQALKLLVVMQPGATLDKRSLARYLSTRLEPHKVPMLYQQVEQVERTYNGKINRKAYCSK